MLKWCSYFTLTSLSRRIESEGSHQAISFSRYSKQYYPNARTPPCPRYAPLSSHYFMLMLALPTNVRMRRPRSR